MRGTEYLREVKALVRFEEVIRMVTDTTPLSGKGAFGLCEVTAMVVEELVGLMWTEVQK